MLRCQCPSVCPSVRLSVTEVHCGHRVQWIPDIFSCSDRGISLLLTDNASPGSSDGMMAGFLVEEGRGHLTLSWPLLGRLVILELRKLHYRCYVNVMFLGCLLYADDILLLSTHIGGLQMMLDTCYKIARYVSLSLMSANVDAWQLAKCTMLLSLLYILVICK